MCHGVTHDHNINGGRTKGNIAGDQSIAPIAKLMTSEMASLAVKIAKKTLHPHSLIHRAFELGQRHSNTAPQVGQFGM